MNRTLWIAGLLAFVCVGCNAGSAPKPMDEAQLKDAVQKLPPQDQIAYINSSPMPAAEKARRIAEIEQKTGYKAPATNVPKTGP